MEIIGWLWWVLSSVVSVLFTVVWFLVSGWVSTLLQIALLIGVIYILKYGWRAAPLQLWRRSLAFGRFFWNWLRARDPIPAGQQVPDPIVRIVTVKEFGDINISTLLSLLMLFGLACAAKLVNMG
jgi:hypothetical protein